MENLIPALEIKDGLFEAGKIHTSFVNNLQTLAFYIQAPEIWETFCKEEPDAATSLKETLVTLVVDWQNRVKEQGLAEVTELELPTSGKSSD